MTPFHSHEVLFPGEVFAEYVSWLMFERPESIDVLVHPLTGSHALWLGRPRKIELGMLAAADEAARAA